MKFALPSLSLASAASGSSEVGSKPAARAGAGRAESASAPAAAPAADGAGAAAMTGYYAQQVRRDVVPGIASGGGNRGIRPAWAPLLTEFLRAAGYRKSAA